MVVLAGNPAPAASGAARGGPRWDVAPAAPPSLAAHFPELHPIAVQVLHARGLTTPDLIRAFLYGDALHDPGALYGMDRAIARITRAIRAGETIAAHGDFDVDGVTATAVLVEGLTAAGAKVVPFIPVRATTGYGVHASAVDKLAADGVTLIVTGDTGTRAIDAVQRATELGIDVIVTDHHLPGEVLPAAHALVNPHQPDCAYPFKELSGCGVAWKLIAALGAGGLLGEFDPEQLLDLVALGTIVDVSPLIGENRWLVQRGLRRLAVSPRPGLQALIASASRGGNGRIDERTVSFGIGPRLNAAGRMDSADLALELVMTRDAARAAELVTLLEQKNTERQQLTEQVLVAARAQAELQTGKPILVIRGEQWAGGVLGLVAARLSDEYRRPAVIVDVGPDACRGSARDSSGLDLVQLLGGCADLLIEFGGHAQAAGFALVPDQLDALAERLVDGCAGRPDPSGRAVVADHRLAEDELSWALYRGLAELRPFGHGNAQPLFLGESLRVLESRPVGADGKHLRMRLRVGKQVVTAFGPNLGGRAASLFGAGAADALFCVESSTWNGVDSLELRLQDVRAAA
jgi:single-stranded-DNA-specific exonuclease